MADVNLNITDLLQVNSGSTFSALEGAAVTAASLTLGTGGAGDGTMIVDGAGSSLMVNTSTALGTAGAIGTLTFQNGSTGNKLSGTVDLMAGSGDTGSTGRLNVLGGSTLQTGTINVGQSSAATNVQAGTLTVDGVGSTLTQTGASTLTVGDDINPNVVSDVILSNSGVMSSGTGAILIQNSGHLNIDSTSTFNANGTVTVDSGTITRGNNSTSFNLASGLTLTAMNNTQIDFTGSYEIDLGTTFDIQSGADLSAFILDIGTTSGDGTLVVDGAGSSVTMTGDSYWGDGGNTANATFRNGATGNLDSIDLARSPAAGTTGVFDIESGATVTTDTLRVASNGGATTSGTITVDGGTTSLTQNGASLLIVGNATNGTATINVQNGGTFTSGTRLSTINTTGTLNVNTAGTFNALGDINLDGTLNVQNGGAVSSIDGIIGFIPGSTGTVTVAGAGSTWTNSSDLFVGGDSAAGGMGSLTVQNQGLVDVAGTLKVWDTGAVTISASDLADWKANYGMVAPLSATTAAVPEPSSLALFSLSGLLFLCRVRRATPFTTSL